MLANENVVKFPTEAMSSHVTDEKELKKLKVGTVNYAYVVDDDIGMQVQELRAEATALGLDATGLLFLNCDFVSVRSSSCNAAPHCG